MSGDTSRWLPAVLDGGGQLATALDGAVEISATHLLLRQPVAYETWRPFVAGLARAGNSLCWLLADALVETEQRMADVADQLEGDLGLSIGSLYNLKSVASKISHDTRRADLSFSHHKVVAAVKGADEQSAWLAAAAERNWTRDELADEIKNARENGDEKFHPRVKLGPSKAAQLRDLAATLWAGSVPLPGHPLHEDAYAVSGPVLREIASLIGRTADAEDSFDA